MSENRNLCAFKCWQSREEVEQSKSGKGRVTVLFTGLRSHSPGLCSQSRREAKSPGLTFLSEAKH